METSFFDVIGFGGHNQKRLQRHGVRVYAYMIFLSRKRKVNPLLLYYFLFLYCTEDWCISGRFCGKLTTLGHSAP